MFELSPEWLTAICSMLILVGGTLSAFYKIFQCLAPDIQFQFSPKSESAFSDEKLEMQRVVLIPKRTKKPYQIVSIYAKFPLYQASYFNDQTEPEIIDFDTPFSLSKPIFIPSSSRLLDDEISIVFLC